MTHYIGGFSRFVTSTTAPIATGRNDSCRVGFAPTGRPCLGTAHAERNHTSKNPPPSNHAALTGSQVAKDDDKEPHRRALHEAIEAERSRLSQAQSLLECLYLALENRDDSDPNRQVYYPDIVEMVRDIVRDSVNRLDSVYIRPLVEAACAR